MTREEAIALLELGRAARLEPGPDASVWMARPEPKRDAFGQAILWLIEAGEVESAVELAAGVWRLWLRSGDVQGGRGLLARALDAAGGRTSTRAFALACYADGLLAFRQGNQADSEARNEAALKVALANGDTAAEALALVGLSRVALRAGDYERVCSLARRARSLVAQAPGPDQVAPLHMVAAGTRLLGDYQGSRELYLESLELNRRLKDDFMITTELHDVAMEHLNQGTLACCAGRSAEALDRLGRAEATLREAGIVLDPDDRFEVDWLRGRLSSA